MNEILSLRFVTDRVRAGSRKSDQAEAWEHVEADKLTALRELVDREIAMLRRLGGN